MSLPPRAAGDGPAVLRPGSSGEAVRGLQHRLRGLGFAVADDAGEYGSSTERAVRAFQTQRGIRVDGVCGAETWGELRDSGYHLGDRLLCMRRPMLRGDDVGDLQARLNALGFDAGKEDAIFGPDTEVALTEFQRNAGISADGICGRETIAMLDRLGTYAGGAVAVARERDALRDPQDLAGRRVYVTAAPELSELAHHLVDGLQAAGAQAVADAGTRTESGFARAANDFGADLFLAIRPRSAAERQLEGGGATCRCSYYAAGTFRSEAGYAIATAVAARVGLALGGTGAACGRAYPVLRETHMTAVVCEPVVEGDEVAIARLAATPLVTADA
ncbi:MAG: peptidoglycan-binding protein, partial [Acidimicrobiia bacterium]